MSPLLAGRAVAGRRTLRGRGWLVAAGVLLAAAALAASQEDVALHRECSYCGMDRQAYGYSRALVRYQDGGEVGTCSLHCAVVELDAHPGKALEVLLVADRDTHQLLDAAAASWVMGGRKRAVMAARAKWAFATPDAAAAFVRDSGGEVIDWPRALAAARQDVASEAKLASARRSNRAFGCAGP